MKAKILAVLMMGFFLLAITAPGALAGIGETGGEPDGDSSLVCALPGVLIGALTLGLWHWPTDWAESCIGLISVGMEG